MLDVVPGESEEEESEGWWRSTKYKVRKESFVVLRGAGGGWMGEAAVAGAGGFFLMVNFKLPRFPSMSSTQ